MKNLYLIVILLIAINSSKAQCLNTIALTGNTISSQNCEALNYISATNNITSTGIGIYHAGNGVLFSPSFVASPGCILHAYIAGCTGTFNAKQSNAGNSNTESLVSDKKIIRIIPNPSNGVFKMSIDNFQEGTIQITDLVGITFYKAGFKNQSDFEINMQENPKGIYIVKVFSGEQVYTEKIIRN